MGRDETARLAAGGSLPWPAQTASPGLARRIWLIAEIGLFYVGAPVVMSWAIFALKIPLFLVLQPVLFGFIVYLLWDDTFHIRRELAVGFTGRTFAAIIIKFILLGGIIAYATQQLFPHLFLSFPKYRPTLWLMVMVIYPLASVVVQELVFRTFFFHRYGPLFGNAKWFAIACNGALFGFAHIIFGNPIAVFGSMVIGWLLAYRYWSSRSFWAVWFEHSLYGCLVFTVGLGHFFFTGVSNLN